METQLLDILVTLHKFGQGEVLMIATDPERVAQFMAGQKGGLSAQDARIFARYLADYADAMEPAREGNGREGRARAVGN